MARTQTAWLVPAIAATLALLAPVAPPTTPGSAPATVDGPVVVELLAKKKAKKNAWLRAEVEVKSSGSLVLRVVSNATKVKVSYKTAKGKKKTATIKLRSGKGNKKLPKGSKSIVVKTKATKKLKASKSLKVPVPRAWLEDIDGDGIKDYVYDATGDGEPEAVLFDNNRNGRFETVAVAGKVGLAFFHDQDENGYYEIILIDADGNGLVERGFDDVDQDGFSEYQWLDLNPVDGQADTWVLSLRPSATTSNKAANDIMVRGIVTLNQMRQLDPWSLGYIRYNPAPSLLRDQYPSCNGLLTCWTRGF